MRITRQDIATAAENAGLDADDYTIRDAYKGWNLTPCAGVSLEPGKLTGFMVCLALHLAEDGRADEARELAQKTGTETLGLVFTAYWPGVQIAA